jgi:hypothetical protein
VEHAGEPPALRSSPRGTTSRSLMREKPCKFKKILPNKG